LTGEQEIEDACRSITQEAKRLGSEVGDVKVLPLYVSFKMYCHLSHSLNTFTRELSCSTRKQKVCMHVCVCVRWSSLRLLSLLCRYSTLIDDFIYLCHLAVTVFHLHIFFGIKYLFVFLSPVQILYTDPCCTATHLRVSAPTTNQRGYARPLPLHFPPFDCLFFKYVLKNLFLL
jgi:hypothetical protein